MAAIITLSLACGLVFRVSAQNYIGAGFHLTPPVYLEYQKNPYVIAAPRMGIGGSITYKREWALKQRRKWYLETGLTLQGLRYYQTDLFGDSLVIWSDFINQFTGYPSVLIGTGYSFPIGNLKSGFSVGGDASFLITQDLFEIISHGFGIIYQPKDAVFPLFLRLNLAYYRDFRLFRLSSGQLQVYADLSAQIITQGSQYIRNPKTGMYREGRYHVNNSEVGIKFFASLNKQKPKKRTTPASVENIVSAQPERNQKIRISLSGQLFKPPNTTYYIPRIDSFSIDSRAIILPQIGITAEIPFKRNHHWSAVFGLGIGKRAGTLIFKSGGTFSQDGQPVGFEQSLDIGHYGIVNAGLSRRNAIKGLVLSHTLTASVVLPLEKEHTYLGVPRAFDPFSPIPYPDAILEGWIDPSNGREDAVAGIEYNPELIIPLKKPVFVAVGLVFNYSFGGTVIANGTYKISNEYATYYGAVLQKFSKIGVSLRVGFEK